MGNQKDIEQARQSLRRRTKKAGFILLCIVGGLMLPCGMGNLLGCVQGRGGCAGQCCAGVGMTAPQLLALTVVLFSLVMLSLLVAVWCASRGHQKSARFAEVVAFGCMLAMVQAAVLTMQKPGQCLLC